MLARPGPKEKASSASPPGLSPDTRLACCWRGMGTGALDPSLEDASSTPPAPVTYMASSEATADVVQCVIFAAGRPTVAEEAHAHEGPAACSMSYSPETEPSPVSLVSCEQACYSPLECREAWEPFALGCRRSRSLPTCRLAVSECPEGGPGPLMLLPGGRSARDREASEVSCSWCWEPWACLSSSAGFSLWGSPGAELWLKASRGAPLGADSRAVGISWWEPDVEASGWTWLLAGLGLAAGVEGGVCGLDLRTGCLAGTLSALLRGSVGLRLKPSELCLQQAHLSDTVLPGCCLATGHDIRSLLSAIALQTCTLYL